MSLQCFYTLRYRVEEHGIIWQAENRLRQNIQIIRQKIHPVDYVVKDPWEAACAGYLFEQFQQHPESELLRTHWMVFLLRRCEIVAKRILPLIDNHQNVGFPDLFMMASVAAINPANFFKNFDESRVQLRCWYPTLIRFTDIKLKHLLLPELRRVTGNNMFGQSNLGLAARSSKKRVGEALKHSGYTKAQIDQYLVAWQCFQEYKDAVNRGVSSFSSQDFQKIADRYNELNQDATSVSGSVIESWLDEIGEAIRRLSEPPRTSFWSHFYSHSSEEINILENIPFEIGYDEEMEENVSKLRQAIANLLNGLQKIQEQQLLFLKYGLELNQCQVARELGGKNQSTISRHLNELNKRILAQIWGWFRQNLRIEPSSTGLAEIQAVLHQHYSEEIDRFVQDSICSLDDRSWRLLNLVYVVRQPIAEIGQMIQRTEQQVRDRLNAIQQQLYSDALAQIQAEFNLNLQPQGAAIQSIPAIVETRLETILQLYAR
jgi:archaellum component FlaC